MSEHQAEQTPREARSDAGAEPGSVDASPTVSTSSEAASEAPAAAALAMSVLESPATAPGHDAAKPDAPPPMPRTTDGPKFPKPDASRGSAKVLIMSPNDGVWHDHSASAKVESKLEPEVKAEKRAAAPTPKRGFLATAAMLLFATMAGALGGALATTGLTHTADATVATPNTGALEASIARIDSDVLALKAGLEHTTKMGVSQFNKTTDRLDKIEKAQAEPNAKLARLADAVDKLRTAPAVAAAPAPTPAPAPLAAAPAPATRDITGTVPQAVAAATPAPAASPAPATPPRPEVGRLPTVEGWTLTDVGYGGALIQGRRGTLEVYAGDYIAGVGRIDAIRKQDGHWVVVTSKGLILPR